MVLAACKWRPAVEVAALTPARPMAYLFDTDANSEVLKPRPAVTAGKVKGSNRLERIPRLTGVCA